MLNLNNFYTKVFVGSTIGITVGFLTRKFLTHKTKEEEEEATNIFTQVGVPFLIEKYVNWIVGDATFRVLGKSGEKRGNPAGHHAMSPREKKEFEKEQQQQQEKEENEEYSSPGATTYHYS